MGVDYSPVGGVGILLTEDMEEILIKQVNDGEYDDIDSVLDELEFSYDMYGNSLSDNPSYCLLVNGTTLIDINKNAPDFIKKLNDLGINISLEDLKVIEELHIW